MKKLQLLTFTAMLLLTLSVKANDSKLNLNNPDVRKCLIEASKSEGWDLSATYLNSEDKIVLIFSKDGQSRVYTSNQMFKM
ncbi:hypothetical protein [Siansivirga zeaxanthinifaciens]|uniref:Secreted protein n=1 Tax=Siansivirga zeaxanthinifaciens CC-SAMT-1 TaxID=1454006 RepID=A0A0C5WEY7_9FLAO|nr:hypothetical protein [Siansivirga zeaxanthinifaciens]AJR04757.1 hypothetical protein AW14_03175 [Siansivirga zeaxanthinifaciens CC-SAMT-1]